MGKKGKKKRKRTGALYYSSPPINRMQTLREIPWEDTAFGLMALFMFGCWVGFVWFSMLNENGIAFMGAVSFGVCALALLVYGMDKVLGFLLWLRELLFLIPATPPKMRDWHLWSKKAHAQFKAEIAVLERNVKITIGLLIVVGVAALALALFDTWELGYATGPVSLFFAFIVWHWWFID